MIPTEKKTFTSTYGKFKWFALYTMTNIPTKKINCVHPNRMFNRPKGAKDTSKPYKIYRQASVTSK